jgi:OPT family oligopeptide transporter
MASLALSWRSIVEAVRWARHGARDDAHGDDTPTPVWLSAFAIGSLSTVTVAWWAFGIGPHISVAAILMSIVLANIAVRAAGETEINPAGPVAKVTQLAFGGGSASTGLMTAAITNAAASQAADLMQDLKTGHLLGASPRKQLLAQLAGTLIGAIVCAPVYWLLDSAYDLGTAPLSAPSARSWYAVATVLSEGLAALPPRADVAACIGLVVGAALPVLRRRWPNKGQYVPSGLAFGVAFLVPAYFSITIFLGTLATHLWSRRSSHSATRFAYPVACALIAGDAIMGVVKAGLQLAGVAPG